jgi:hypothetical protein
LGTRSTHQAETKEDDVSQEDGREQRASRVTRDLYTWLLRETKGRRVVGFLGELLSRQDRVYLLSLLIPFAIYNLAFGGEQERPRFIAGAS